MSSQPNHAQNDTVINLVSLLLYLDSRSHPLIQEGLLNPLAKT